MQEIKADIFEYWRTYGGILGITTNGDVNIRGQAIMGRGIARDAKEYWPDLPILLGEKLSLTGNHVYFIYDLERIDNTFSWQHQEIPGRLMCFTFPTKHHWWQNSDLNLIKRSSIELMEKRISHGYEKEVLLLPRPGCGAGKLEWNLVKEAIASLLDDNVIIVDREYNGLES